MFNGMPLICFQGAKSEQLRDRLRSKTTDRPGSGLPRCTSMHFQTPICSALRHSAVHCSLLRKWVSLVCLQWRMDTTVTARHKGMG